MRMRRELVVAMLAGLLVLLPETLRGEAICGKERPLKPVHCVCSSAANSLIRAVPPFRVS
jgi:hypothetical protein